MQKKGKISQLLLLKVNKFFSSWTKKIKKMAQVLKINNTEFY